MGQVVSFHKARNKIHKTSVDTSNEIEITKQKLRNAKVVRIFNLPDQEVRKKFVFVLSIPKDPAEMINRLILTMGIMVVVAMTLL